MKIAFPTQEDRGLDSPVYGHFGSARFFVIAETGDHTAETVQNPEVDHIHGQCQPLRALGGRPVDAVVVGGIGGGALGKLRASGIKVYRAVEGTVDENLALIQSGKLPEFNLLHTCAGHDHDHACAH